MTPLLGEALLAVSTALLVPVMVALIALLGWSLLQVGAVAGEALGRRQRLAAWRRWVAGCLDADPTVLQGMLTPAAMAGAWPGTAPEAVRAFRLDLPEKSLDDIQLQLERSLGRLHLGLRLGPMFGLAGTLIPLGPALIGLSSGDTETLAQNLVVAFATTVVGLVCGAICLVTHGVRQRWAAQLLSDVNHVLGRLA